MRIIASTPFLCIVLLRVDILTGQFTEYDWLKINGDARSSFPLGGFDLSNFNMNHNLKARTTSVMLPHRLGGQDSSRRPLSLAHLLRRKLLKLVETKKSENRPAPVFHAMNNPWLQPFFPFPDAWQNTTSPPTQPKWSPVFNPLVYPKMQNRPLLQKFPNNRSDDLKLASPLVQVYVLASGNGGAHNTLGGGYSGLAQGQHLGFSGIDFEGDKHKTSSNNNGTMLSRYTGYPHNQGPVTVKNPALPVADFPGEDFVNAKPFYFPPHPRTGNVETASTNESSNAYGMRINYPALWQL